MSFETLMAKAQQGDKRAYAQLLQDVVPLIHSFLKNRLSYHDDLNDITQEILISIHKASSSYDPSRDFNAWVYAIIRYRLSDYLRNVYRKKAHGTDVEFNDETCGTVKSADVSNNYDQVEYLNKALASLPSKQQKIFTMLRIDGYSVRETSIAMGMTESAVKVNIHRASKKLSAHYLDEVS